MERTRGSGQAGKSPCAGLKGLLEGKEYFVVTTLEDPKPLEAAAEESRIAAPFSGEAVPAGTEERWQAYMKWLHGDAEQNAASAGDWE